MLVSVAAGSSQSGQTSTITRPIPSIVTAHAWDTVGLDLQNKIEHLTKNIKKDMNKNIRSHMLLVLLNPLSSCEPTP